MHEQRQRRRHRRGGGLSPGSGRHIHIATTAAAGASNLSTDRRIGSRRLEPNLGKEKGQRTCQIKPSKLTIPLARFFSFIPVLSTQTGRRSYCNCCHSSYNQLLVTGAVAATGATRLLEQCKEAGEGGPLLCAHLHSH